MTSSVRVIKVGGSLFDFAGLASELERWRAARPSCLDVLIAGGGKFADAIREADSLHSIGDGTCHWLCVQLLDVTAQLLRNLVPETRLTRRLGDIAAAAEAGRQDTWVLAVEDFLRREEPGMSGTPLPQDWHTGSDAIAARVAQALRADELVLVKSCDLPGRTDRRAAAQRGLVDDAFPEAATGLTVRWLNLRGGGTTATL